MTSPCHVELQVKEKPKAIRKAKEPRKSKSTAVAKKAQKQDPETTA